MKWLSIHDGLQCLQINFDGVNKLTAWIEMLYYQDYLLKFRKIL